jgi:Holliday junction resolvase RusA-like endonuclease
MKTAEFEITGDFPSINGKYGYSAQNKKLFTNAKYILYKTNVSCFATLGTKHKIKKSVEVHIEVWTAKDIDNLIKATLDGMNGICYDDDRQIERLSVIKHTIKKREMETIKIQVYEYDVNANGA